MAAMEWADNPTRPSDYELLRHADEEALRGDPETLSMLSQGVFSYTSGLRHRCFVCYWKPFQVAQMAWLHGVRYGFYSNARPHLERRVRQVAGRERDGGIRQPIRSPCLRRLRPGASMTHQDISNLRIGAIIHSHREGGRCVENVLAGHAHPETGTLATLESLWTGGGRLTIENWKLAYLHLPEDCLNSHGAQATSRSVVARRVA